MGELYDFSQKSQKNIKSTSRNMKKCWKYKLFDYN